MIAKINYYFNFCNYLLLKIAKMRNSVMIALPRVMSGMIRILRSQSSE